MKPGKLKCRMAVSQCDSTRAELSVSSKSKKLLDDSAYLNLHYVTPDAEYFIISAVNRSICSGKKKEFRHNKSMHSQHLYWCKPCDPVEQSSWRPGLSKLRHTGRRSPQQGPQTLEWKATSILAQTTSVTQIRQAQYTGSLSPAAGGGQADLHRMETFSWT